MKRDNFFVWRKGNHARIALLTAQIIIRLAFQIVLPSAKSEINFPYLKALHFVWKNYVHFINCTHRMDVSIKIWPGNVSGCAAKIMMRTIFLYRNLIVQHQQYRCRVNFAPISSFANLLRCIFCCSWKMVCLFSCHFTTLINSELIANEYFTRRLIAKFNVVK